ncbi:MAG TPA: hypothetical protein VGF94_08460 [Kofleriaceae bacterium]|jgi:hypothetical protein
MATKKSRSSRSPLQRGRDLLVSALDRCEKRISKGDEGAERTAALLMGEIRKLDAHDRRLSPAINLEAVLLWARQLEPAARSELARKVLAIDGPRGSGLA